MCCIKSETFILKSSFKLIELGISLLTLSNFSETKKHASEAAARYYWNSIAGVKKTSYYIQNEPRKKLTFHDTGWLVGVLKLVYYNPYITG